MERNGFAKVMSGLTTFGSSLATQIAFSERF